MRKTKRQAFKDANIDLPTKTSVTCKPSRQTSAFQSKRNSTNNSLSVSPSRPNINLYLVSPCSVKLSKQLQEKLKGRTTSKSKRTTKNITVFSRNLNWKLETDVKIKNLKIQKEKKELFECTFTPRVNFYGENSRRSSQERKKPQMFCFNTFSYMESGVRDGKINLESDDDIERSFQRVTNTLDTMSKQILQSIATSRV